MSPRRLIALSCLVTLVACAAELEEEPTGEVTPELIIFNSLSWLDLSPNLPLAYQVIAAPLRPSPQTALLVDTASGYRVLTYLVGCGLPAGRRVWLPNSAGVPKPFDGQIGFAPGWSASAPTPVEQTWIMGCIAARENALGVRIELDLRALHPALQPFSPGYTQEDGGFWADPVTKTLMSCRGEGHVQMCGEDDESWGKRTCDESDPRCPMIYCGRCSKICTPGPNGTKPDCTCDKKVYKQVEMAFLKAGTFYGCD